MVAKFAARESIPFYSFRAISDTAGHSFDIHLNELRDAEGRFEKGRIVIEYRGNDDLQRLLEKLGVEA